MRIYGSTAYLALHAAPEGPDKLKAYSTLAITGHGRSDADRWRLSDGHYAADYPIRATAIADDPEVLRHMMLAGGGLLLATDLQMRSTVSAGEARIVLPGWHGVGPDLYAVMPAGRNQPPKVRALLDYLVPRLDLIQLDGGSQ
jgi:DNA-binding transcriptional LysR family regulator